jgi:predicted homoserine dehydrogenase-like protein
MELYEKLCKRQANGEMIHTGLVGVGQMGHGLVHVTDKMPGVVTSVLADVNVDRALAVLEAIDVPKEQICVTNQAGEGNDALNKGKYVVTEDALMLPELDRLEAVVEVTGITEVGAQVAFNTIMSGKHCIMMNVETDVTVGVALDRIAEKNGVVYTVAEGDEPAVCKMLYDFAMCTGFEVVCLGKGKNNVVDYYATPDSCTEEAHSKGMNPKILASFKDGTKTMVEMAAVCNATGMIPDIPGMHGPKVEIPDLVNTFIPKKDGGIFDNWGVVDYSTGKIAPGVFAIVYSDNDVVVEDMRFVGLGDGPYYLLLRPYHLINIEAPLSIAQAVIYGERTVSPKTMMAELIPVAKRDLKVGEVVGGIGSADIYNKIYTYTEASAKKAVPMGIVPGAKVTKDIARDEILTEDNVQVDTSPFVYNLRQVQNQMLVREKDNGHG